MWRSWCGLLPITVGVVLAVITGQNAWAVGFILGALGVNLWVLTRQPWAERQGGTVGVWLLVAAVVASLANGHLGRGESVALMLIAIVVGKIIITAPALPWRRLSRRELVVALVSTIAVAGVVWGGTTLIAWCPWLSPLFAPVVVAGLGVVPLLVTARAASGVVAGEQLVGLVFGLGLIGVVVGEVTLGMAGWVLPVLVLLALGKIKTSRWYGWLVIVCSLALLVTLYW